MKTKYIMCLTIGLAVIGAILCDCGIIITGVTFMCFGTFGTIMAPVLADQFQSEDRP